MIQAKFRGKRIDNGQWVHGYLLVGALWGFDESHWIFCDGQFARVIPETVGQFTGAIDQNFNNIYEGDVLLIAGRKLKVIFDNSTFLTVAGSDRYSLGCWGSEGVKIIGNIHDHPHLLNPPQGNAAFNTMNKYIDPKDPNEGQEQQEAAAEQATEETGGEGKGALVD